jgi:hypothetical protein
MRVGAAPRRTVSRKGRHPAMSIQAALLPVFVMVVLTFALMFAMGYLRVNSLKRGELKIKDMALGQPAWPVRPTQVANAYHNQLQLPVLFYLLTVLALITRLADLAFVIMAWLFVVSRLAHAYVFVTTNNVPKRFRAFLVGALILLAMWIVFIVRVLITF